MATEAAPASYNYWVSTCMMLLIGTYLGMNNLMTSVFDELGFNALTTLFACLTAGHLFAPSVIARTGARTALLIGAGCHCTINVVAAVAAQHRSVDWLLYVFAPIAGFGASLLWTGHAIYTASLGPPEATSHLFGTFFSIFGFNGVLIFGVQLVLNRSSGGGGDGGGGGSGGAR